MPERPKCRSREADTSGTVADTREGADMKQDIPRSTAEAAIRDKVANTATRLGWRVSVEWRLQPFGHSWGIVDLMMTKAGEQPVLVEFKRSVSTMSALRKAATQAHGYRTVAAIYFREPCAAYVVADALPDDETMTWLCAGMLDVHTVATDDFTSLLTRQAEPGGRDVLATERGWGETLGARARMEDIYGLNEPSPYNPYRYLPKRDPVTT